MRVINQPRCAGDLSVSLGLQCAAVFNLWDCLPSLPSWSCGNASLYSETVTEVLENVVRAISSRMNGTTVIRNAFLDADALPTAQLFDWRKLYTTITRCSGWFEYIVSEGHNKNQTAYDWSRNVSQEFCHTFETLLNTLDQAGAKNVKMIVEREKQFQEEAYGVFSPLSMGRCDSASSHTLHSFDRPERATHVFLGALFVWSMYVLSVAASMYRNSVAIAAEDSLAMQTLSRQARTAALSSSGELESGPVVPAESLSIESQPLGPQESNRSGSS